MTRGSSRLTFAVLVVAVSAFSLLQSMTIPALPRIQHELDTDQATAAWVLTAFLLAASVATPIVGRLGDAYGKRRLLVISLVLLGTGAVAASLAPSIGVMLGARVLQGLGGGILPLSFGIIRDEIPTRRIPFAISLISSLMAVGFGAGIVLAGPIMDHLGYHSMFLLPAGVAYLAALATALIVPESGARSFTRPSLMPTIALTGWLLAFLLGLSNAPHWGWASTEVVALFALAAVGFGGWVLAERHARVPLIDLRLMTLRGVWTANLVAMLTGIAMYASMGFLPQFTQTPSENGYGFGASTSEAGHMILPSAVASFLMGLVAARTARRLGVRATIVLGSVVTASSLAIAAFAHQHRWEMYLIGVLSGAGTGLAFGILANAVVQAVPANQTGVASGMNANLRTMGGAIGAALMTTVVTADKLPSGYPAESGYTVGFAMLGVAALLAALAALLLPGGGTGLRRPAMMREARLSPLRASDAVPTR